VSIDSFVIDELWSEQERSMSWMLIKGTSMLRVSVARSTTDFPSSNEEPRGNGHARTGLEGSEIGMAFEKLTT
jgi:hypothetical protein